MLPESVGDYDNLAAFKGLVEKFRDHIKPVGFFGAGNSISADYPLYAKLIEDFFDKNKKAREQIRDNFKDQRKENERNAIEKALSEIMEDGNMREGFYQYLEQTFRIRTYDIKLEGFAEIPFSAYITTNYDGFIEAILSREGKSIQSQCFQSTANATIILRDFVDRILKEGGYRHAVIHLHGCAGNNPVEYWITSPDKIRETYTTKTPQKTFLKNVFDNYVVVLMGCSLKDYYIELLRDEQPIHREGTCRHFAILCQDEYDSLNHQNLIKQYGIRPIYFNLLPGSPNDKEDAKTRGYKFFIKRLDFEIRKLITSETQGVTTEGEEQTIDNNSSQ